MKALLLIVSITAVLMAESYTSTVKIPFHECQKYRSANTVGGTMFSRHYYDKKKQQAADHLASYSLNEAADKIVDLHHLDFDNLEITTVGCNVLYKAENTSNRYYFDGSTLALITTKER